MLKILDPLPEEVFGDLYFELHEKNAKCILSLMWIGQRGPDSVGAIRYGFFKRNAQIFPMTPVFLQPISSL
ncbi:MAG: hypothetical protein R3E67_04785 [Pseudomonadales bacterium]